MRYFLRSKLHVIFTLLTTFVIVAAAVVLPLSGLFSHTHAQGSVSFSEYPVPTTNSNPGGITTGPDGNLWFTEVSGNKVGTMTPSGAFNEYPVPTSNSGVERITTGPDGNLWFTEPFVNQIGQITPTGSITEFHVPTSGSYPEDIITGPDGNLWFTEYFGNQIGQITPTGSITEFPLPAGSNNPNHITVGPDGNLWFTEYGSDQIGVITTSGALIAQYLVPTANSNPGDITVGPDGNLWFVEVNANQIGRITPTGSISEYQVPTTVSHLGSITAGPDGNVWFTEFFAPNIGRITPSGAITEFPLPNGGAPDGITSGPLNSLWLTDWSSNEIDQATPTTTPPPTESWITPTDGFSVQSGAFLKLSANASPAQATSSILRVDFEANWNGTWQVICTTYSASNIFTCSWNLADASKIPIPIGLLQLEFAVYDSSGTTLLGPVIQGTKVPQQMPPSTYAGYSVSGQTYSDVKGSWVQPSITCGANENSTAGFWVGISGGLGTKKGTIAQIGTAAECDKGTVVYYAWYQFVPENKTATPILLLLNPGDSVQAEVKYLGSDLFLLSIAINGLRNGFPFVTLQTQKSTRDSAEWIAESAKNLWPPFGTVTFTDCSANGDTIPGTAIANGPIVSEWTIWSKKQIKGSPSALTANGTSFSVQWEHA